jgi:hypothetical protein
LPQTNETLTLCIIAVAMAGAMNTEKNLPIEQAEIKAHHERTKN